MLYHKICEKCNLPFDSTNYRKRFCDREHYGICKVCGNKYLLTNELLLNPTQRVTCSKACTAELRKRTNLNKYGVEHPTQSDMIKAKTRETNLHKYGVENPMQSQEIKNRWEENNLKRTGYRHHWANPDIIAKSEATWREKYGEQVKRPQQSTEVRQHTIATNKLKYGVENPTQNADILDKVRETNLIRYGSPNVMSNPEIAERARNTIKERYGTPYYSQTDAWRLGVMMNPARIEFYNEFKQDPRAFIHKYFDKKPSLDELYEITGVGHEAVTRILDQANCRDEVAFVFSIMEREVANILLEINPNLIIEYNTHKLITPYEIDIYLPEYNIGIECNPTSTHNSSIALLNIDGKGKPTPRNYHAMKTNLCEEKGIFLFHIFGPEWKYKREIIVSMLRNLIGKNENKIYARNTVIREVDSPTAIQFLNHNHRQGRVFSSIRLGLYDKKTNELVSLMTFGKLRKTMGTNKGASDEIWELTRFCNKLNTSVVGGASKLFKYFIDNYSPKEIRSFSDRSHTRGNLYSTLGFRELRRSGESYVWIDLKTDRAFHRIHAQKRNIRRFLNDPTIDIDNQTEFQIMESHGFVSMFDSGTITWQWTRN